MSGMYGINPPASYQEDQMWPYQHRTEPFPAFNSLHIQNNPWGAAPLNPIFAQRWNVFMAGGQLTGNLMDHWGPPQGGSIFNHPGIPTPHMNPRFHGLARWS